MRTDKKAGMAGVLVVVHGKRLQSLLSGRGDLDCDDMAYFSNFSGDRRGWRPHTVRGADLKAFGSCRLSGNSLPLGGIYATSLYF